MMIEDLNKIETMVNVEIKLLTIFYFVNNLTSLFVTPNENTGPLMLSFVIFNVNNMSQSACHVYLILMLYLLVHHVLGCNMKERHKILDFYWYEVVNDDKSERTIFWMSLILYMMIPCILCPNVTRDIWSWVGLNWDIESK